MADSGSFDQRRPRVVIIGGGFGGLEAAKRLRKANVDITLIDRTNHELFQPLIYSVAAGIMSDGDVSAPIRWILRNHQNVEVLMAAVEDVDVENRIVTLDRGEHIEYDSLIVACGGTTSYFGRNEWQEVTCALKTLDDAMVLRNRIFKAFEEAERETDPAIRAEWLTFVVVGGGPTGVEISGQLAILSRHAMKRDFRRIDPAAAQVILLDAGDRVVSAFSEKTSAIAAKELSQLGVTVREHAMVTDIDADTVTAKIGDESEQIRARTVVWAAGVQTAEITRAVAKSAGVETDRGGHIAVQPDLTVPGHPEISVIGDAASVAGPEGRPLPGLATVAIQEARHVAKAIRAGQTGATTPFKYFDKGALAVVGRGKAVCEVRGHRLHGWPAFLMYCFVHLFYLSGVGGRRVTVLITALGGVFGAREHRVIQGELGQAKAPAAAAGAGVNGETA